MSQGCVALLLIGDGFPRVSGDEPKSETFRNFIDGFSPRERG